MKTTLNKIRAKSPCKSGWETLLKSLGKTQADDDELALLTILDSNGIEDAIWCLRAVEGHDTEILAFARFCAKQNIEAIKSYTDENSYNLIIKWLDYGDESIKSAAESAARLAAWSASRQSIRFAGWSAARAVAWAAARSAEASAARLTPCVVAWSAARLAAEASARSAAEQVAQSSAWSAQEIEFRRILRDNHDTSTNAVNTDNV